MSSIHSPGLTQPQIVQLFGQAARQVYWPGVTSGRISDCDEVRHYLARQALPPSEQDFLNPRRGGKLRLGFSGLCAEKRDGSHFNITDGRFDDCVNRIIGGLRGPLGRVVFGATYWSFMPALAKASVRDARATLVGVMPEKGLRNLAQVSHLFAGESAVPPMDYLAIVGSAYDDPVYTAFMADCMDGMVSLGGRRGATAEVTAALDHRKPVYLAPVTLEDDEDEIRSLVLGGMIYAQDVDALTHLIAHDFSPHADAVNAPTLSFRDHLTPHQFLERHIKDVVLGTVSSSGSERDYNRIGKIYEALIRGITPRRSYVGGDVLGLGGMTAEGGIRAFYESCLNNSIATAGIMCWKGANYTLARGAGEMVIVGEEWGAESATFTTLSDLLLVVEPGKQGWEETLTFRQTRRIDGKLPPVIVIDDPILAAQRGVTRPEIPGAIVVSVNDLDAAVRALNDAIQTVRRQRGHL